MIHATNIGTSSVIRKDHKKGKVELMMRYTPIGVIDDYLDPKEADGSKYSMLGKARHLQVQSAK